MTWFTPIPCSCLCVPCTKPVARCKRNSTHFHYEVENAVEAWIDETCTDPYGAITVTHHPITLTGTTATGDFPASLECTYCVRAISDCGKVATCCDVCETPTCTLSVTRDTYGELVITWSYNANSATDLIISADVGGIDVFTGPFRESIGNGTFTTPLSALMLESATFSGMLFNQIVLTVTNDCGKVTKCLFTVPCCWELTQTRVSISGLSDTYTETIDAVTRSQGGSASQFYNKHSMQVEGLAAFNGTHFLNNMIPQRSQASTGETCDSSSNFVAIGTMKITEKIVANGRDFSTFPFRNWDYTFTLVAEFTAYLGAVVNPAVPAGLSGYQGGIWLQYANMTFDDLLIYHPNGSNPGFSAPRSFSGCSKDMNQPFTAPCTNDGVYGGLQMGIGFFGTVVPVGTTGGMTDIQHQPTFLCRRPQTRDFFAPSRFASMPQFMANAWNGANTSQYCPIHQVIFPDAVELEYV